MTEGMPSQLAGRRAFIEQVLAEDGAPPTGNADVQRTAPPDVIALGICILGHPLSMRTTYRRIVEGGETRYEVDMHTCCTKCDSQRAGELLRHLLGGGEPHEGPPYEHRLTLPVEEPVEDTEDST